MPRGDDAHDARVGRRWRVATVAYFNSAPLIAGLADVPGVELSAAVPSGLARRLAGGEVDVALLPVIDYQRHAGLVLLPTAGGIGCDGPTLTVRIFARTPVAGLTRLCCDSDSHTSVALARVVLRRLLGCTPELAPLNAADDRPGEGRLLIGDKVITAAPPDMPHQLDLGQAWKVLTGLPFVFACWTARAGQDQADLGALVETLAACRRRGLADPDALVRAHAVPRGWPADLARRYVTEHLRYDVGPRQLRAVRLFHQYAAEDNLIARPPRPLVTPDR